ncbi:type II toxin-antitoxin system RelE/ParE family toxin [Fusibacter sp. 3D3]|uniref:type II toxin-antitoxin system RelE family toxin n=1 Tax=Fusibacter sp. 3D3 TaxID=1048380 RepID=UPI000852E861|nr:hypothetical protein [Fusibacter sp. 3D3]
MDNSIAKQVLAGIKKVSQNPLRQSEGGYGKPLGSHNATELTGFFKIKYRGIGIRVVYTIVRQKNVMNIIVVWEFRPWMVTPIFATSSRGQKNHKFSTKMVESWSHGR